METTELVKSLEKLADKLGTTAEKLFGYYVKNAKLNKYYYVIELCVSVILLVVGAILFCNNYTIDPGYTIQQLAFAIIGGLIGLIGLGTTIVGLFSISRFLNSLLNPEYAAIEDLLSTLLSGGE